MAKRGKGRPRVGPSVCVALTPDQVRWLHAQVPPGGSVSATVRAIIQAAMAAEPAAERAG